VVRTGIYLLFTTNKVIGTTAKHRIHIRTLKIGYSGNKRNPPNIPKTNEAPKTAHINSLNVIGLIVLSDS
jgi:hypothetical protein